MFGIQCAAKPQHYEIGSYAVTKIFNFLLIRRFVRYGLCEINIPKSYFLKRSVFILLELLTEIPRYYVKELSILLETWTKHFNSNACTVM